MSSEHRVELNRHVLVAVQELPFSADVSPQVLEDAELGAMTAPRLLLPDDLQRYTLTRRIPVRELRSKGWRTRVNQKAGATVPLFLVIGFSVTRWTLCPRWFSIVFRRKQTSVCGNEMCPGHSAVCPWLLII